MAANKLANEFLILNTNEASLLFSVFDQDNSW